jgi:cytidine deaminase
MKRIIYSELDEKQKKLLDAASEIMETAYNPYSHFYVGAALLTVDDEIICGSNVENAAYGSTICAERAALVRANALGARMFESLAIVTRGENFKTAEPSASCGACRQMLYEASQVTGKDLEIIMANTDRSKIVIATINELLPMAFGPHDVGVDVKRYQKI